MSEDNEPRSDRPAIDIVVPFAGGAEEAERMAANLGHLELEDRDELVIVDNSPVPVVQGRAPSGARVLERAEERSSYYARNAGAETGGAEWILFLDADCEPGAGLLQAFFVIPVETGIGIIAGRVVPASGRGSFAERYSESRNPDGVLFHLETGPWPAGVGANLLVRREAWCAVGGFHEGIRSGADVELCWRIQELGWRLRYERAARVGHQHFDTISLVLARARTYGAGRRWITRRYPGSLPAPEAVRPAIRGVGGAAWWLARARPRAAAFKLLDVAWSLEMVRGYWRTGNRAQRVERGTPVTGRALVADRFAVPRPETASDPSAPIVEAARRPGRVAPEPARRGIVRWAEDDAPLHRLRALARLLIRHPARCARDTLDRSSEGSREPLRALAPGIGRLRDAGVRAIVPATEEVDRRRAERLGRLAGIPVDGAADRSPS